VLTKKGLDVTVSSITYKTYSTRGFNGSGSSRVNQIMDGMDNQAPGLNFSVGNFVGLPDLDIESIEIPSRCIICPLWTGRYERNNYSEQQKSIF
jgi:hypothetical protein